MAFRRGPSKPKHPKGIDDAFLEGIQAEQTESLHKKIVGYQDDLATVAAFVKDEFGKNGVKKARAALKLITGPSDETKKMLQNRTTAVLKLLKERGAA